MQDGSTLDIVNQKYASISPLAERLFNIKGINRVFYAKDYISISKTEESQWDNLKEEVIKLIKQHFEEKKEPLLLDSQPNSDTIKEEDSEVVQMIKEIIDTRIRPMVQDDGGDIIFKRFNEDSGIVILSMMGSCSGCPSSQVTLKNGIEKMIMHYVPEVSGVESEDFGEQN
ncbi:hypothetical protein IMG5_041320 [Ichthyophthirius multifiliis]|uniref:Scaffold protein Nfu/NifU N-terminal domain-containing protein n=1 Tax=Ichthyophthirius multifiliis TaxID=5932 RepID=G0QM16_ICHMU|nr:hypothetical protein IMG5_041320 [Ichthyophthirius multifiliis]EGR33740.1 hypothetical protein IMG5_041320 [Ichthyophthirius multifiliis]|eukprot:XP_004037726.1 hypothetical protein IMG5_041320 [Ichthyophthirius multifiliis]